MSDVPLRDRKLRSYVTCATLLAPRSISATAIAQIAVVVTVLALAQSRRSWVNLSRGISRPPSSVRKGLRICFGPKTRRESGSPDGQTAQQLLREAEWSCALSASTSLRFHVGNNGCCCRYRGNSRDQSASKLNMYYSFIRLMSLCATTRSTENEKSRYLRPSRLHSDIVDNLCWV